MFKFIFMLFLIISIDSVFAASETFSKSFNRKFTRLEEEIKNFKLIAAREDLNDFILNGVNKDEWIKIRDLIHSNQQVGLDIMLKFDSISPYKLNKVDLAIKQADKLMLEKKFKSAVNGYQTVLKFITKNKKFKTGRNHQLYWSLIHSLARAFYSIQQYDEAFTLYQSIPITYPFYRQAQFESMWNSYMNDKFEYALGAIANMSSGNFSKILEPEVYLVQYYIYKRLCRTKEAEILKKKVSGYQKAVEGLDFQLGSWIKKDVVNLIYRQILQSGDLSSEETSNLKAILEKEKNKDFDRIQKEFELVIAHLDIDNGINNNLKQVNRTLTKEQILSNAYELWNAGESEIWADEQGKYVYVQKDLCKVE